MADIRNLSAFDIDNGKFLAQTEAELVKIVKDIYDLNKNATDKREINIKIVLKPTESRREAELTYEVTSKLGKHPARKARLFLDAVDGQVYARPATAEPSLPVQAFDEL